MPAFVARPLVRKNVGQPIAYSLLLIFLLLPVLACAQGLAITQVQPDRTLANPQARESVTLRFALSAPAAVTLRLFDGRDLQVRAIASKKSLAAGEHSLQWDLRDEAGRAVPPEAYTYVLEARATDGTTVRYDLADATGGESVTARDVKWDVQTGRLTYVLDKPSRVNIRFGLNDGGPLLRTLIDWAARPAGLREETWDGKDGSGVLDLATHPRLAIGVQAFSLPENSLLVGAPPSQVRLIDLPAAKRIERPHSSNSQPKRMHTHAQQPLETRGDFKVQLSLPASLPRSPGGLPIVSATVPVRLEVDAKDRERALSRRFEPVFFIDGQFAFENEVGFVPMTWNFDPAAFNDGEHFLTVNLRGYEGNFGMATVKVWVQRETISATGATR